MINIAVLLKDCPKGMELDCVLYDDVTFLCVFDDSCYPIQIQTPEGVMRLSRYGCLLLTTHAKCIIFPKGKTTWEGFVPPCKFKDGDIVALDTEIGVQLFIFKEYIEAEKNYVHCYMMLDDDGTVDLGCDDFYVERFATEEEKQKLFDAIKANGYKWNEETKTLEKLVPNKFDISTLKPFESRVLVRDYDMKMWIPYFFGCLDNSNECPYMVVGGLRWKCCIPFEGNEHLLGTTDDCIDFYKTWE